MKINNNYTARNKQKRPVWLLGLIILLALVSGAGGLWLSFAGCGDFYGESPGVTFAGLGFLILGALVVRNRPENRIGWLASLIGLQLFSTPVLLGDYVRCGEVLELPGVPYVAWFGFIIGPYLLVTQFILLPHLFPNDHFLSSRWRAIAWIGIGFFAITLLLLALLPGPLVNPYTGPIDVINPFGVKSLPTEILGPPLLYTNYFIMIGSIFVAIASLIVRWRRSEGDERQQVKWFTYFLGMVVSIYIVIFEVIGPLFLYPNLSEGLANIYDFLYSYVVISLIYMGFPIILGITIFKYRLYDIDLIIRKTLQYTLLTGALALAYFGGVVLLQTILSSLTGESNSPLVIVISTLAIAALFNPLRTRIQNFIDRRFYRQKYDAERALTQFAASARDEVDIDNLHSALLGVVEETMQPEIASLWIKNPDLQFRGSIERFSHYK